MFAKKNTDDNPTLDDLITSVSLQMDSHDAHSDEYALMLERLSKLHDIKNNRKKKFDIPSSDTMLVVAGNLAGLLMIVNFEQTGVITSKALGFVLKLKA